MGLIILIIVIVDNTNTVRRIIFFLFGVLSIPKNTGRERINE